MPELAQSVRDRPRQRGRRLPNALLAAASARRRARALPPYTDRVRGRQLPWRSHARHANRRYRTRPEVVFLLSSQPVSDAHATLLHALYPSDSCRLPRCQSSATNCVMTTNEHETDANWTRCLAAGAMGPRRSTSPRDRAGGWMPRKYRWRPAGRGKTSGFPNDG